MNIKQEFIEEYIKIIKSKEKAIIEWSKVSKGDKTATKQAKDIYKELIDFQNYEDAMIYSSLF